MIFFLIFEAMFFFRVLEQEHFITKKYKKKIKKMFFYI